MEAKYVSILNSLGNYMIKEDENNRELMKLESTLANIKSQLKLAKAEVIEDSAVVIDKLTEKVRFYDEKMKDLKSQAALGIYRNENKDNPIKIRKENKVEAPAKQNDINKIIGYYDPDLDEAEVEAKVDKLSAKLLHLSQDRLIEGITFDAHDEKVNCMLNIDDSFIASGGEDGILIWAPDSKNIVNCFTQHNSEVVEIQHLQDKLLISCDKLSSIYVWDYERLLVVSETTLSNYTITKILVLTDFILLATGKGNLITMSKQDYSVITSISAHDSSICSIINYNSSHFITSSTDRKVKLWNSKKLSTVNSLEVDNEIELYPLIMLEITKEKNCNLVVYQQFMIEIWDVIPLSKKKKVSVSGLSNLIALEGRLLYTAKEKICMIYLKELQETHTLTTNLHTPNHIISINGFIAVNIPNSGITVFKTELKNL